MKKLEYADIPPSELKRLRTLIAAVVWRESSTYPAHMQHAYILNKNVPYACAALREAIRKYGYIDYFKGEPQYYLVIDQYKYWAYDTLVNREHIDLTLARQ